MADEKVSFPYVVGTTKLIDLIKKIPDIGVPSKFTRKMLKGLGYTSSNDDRFVPTLKFIGLLEQDGTPSELWTHARGDLGGALATGIRSGYASLFQQYPNAHQKDDEALRTFFTVHSGTGKVAVARMLATFKALCSSANFDKETHQLANQKPDSIEQKGKNGAKIHYEEQTSLAKGAVPVSINIQLQLPPDTTGEIYDKFFAAMAKHLPVK